MKIIFSQVARLSSKDLPKELFDIAAKGFIEEGQCFILQHMASREKNVSISNFPDLTGYECFINCLHIDDYVGQDYLFWSLKFMDVVLNSWRAMNKEHKLRAIVSTDDLGAVIRFHVLRENENWLSDDLESYKEEAVLFMDSTQSP